MKILKTNTEAFWKGFDETARVVASTLGPHGRNVYIHETFQPRIINDGVRVANSINFEDPVENAGAYIVKNASAKTNDDVGDGTTTTAVLLRAIVNEARKRTESPAVIKKSLEEATKKAVELLKKQAVPMKDEDIHRVALLSSEHEDVAQAIEDIYKELGNGAVISIEDSKSEVTNYEVSDGWEGRAGFLSPWFINDMQTGKAVFEEIPVIVIKKKLATIQNLQPFLQYRQESGLDKCAFFVDEIDDSILAFLVKNKVNGLLNSVVVRANMEQLDDIVAVTGSTPISDASGVSFEKFDPVKHMGKAHKLVVDAHTTLIQGDGKGARNRALELELDATNEPNGYRKDKLEERAARLRGKIAILKVGGFTDLEREYKKLKAEDAVKCLPAAFDEGLVDGAGKTWYEIAAKLKGDTVGEQILSKALLLPTAQLMENSGEDNISSEGIIDPCKVERVSLENASSAAGIAITTIAVIAEYPDAENKRS